MTIPPGAPLDATWEAEVESFMDLVDHDLIGFAEQLPTARRITWEMVNEQQLPPGYWLRHDCGTRECVNPAHAELVPIDSRTTSASTG